VQEALYVLDSRDLQEALFFKNIALKPPDHQIEHGGGL